MFCRVAGTAALALLVSTAAWAQVGGSGSGQSGTSGSGSDSSGRSSTGSSDKTDTMGTNTSSSGQDTTSTRTTQTTTSTTDNAMGSDRPRLELAGFAGYTFNQGLDFNSGNGRLAASDVNFYNSIGLEDRFSYGASLGYDVTSNLQVGFLWSRMSGPLELRGFDANAAIAAGWSGPNSGSGGVGSGGTGGTSTGGTGGSGSGRATFPALITTNGVSPYSIGDTDVNTFHGTLGWNFGPVDAAVRPFLFGGAGVTRYGPIDYQFADMASGATPGSMASARIQPDSRFSTTWGVGVKIAPARGLGVRIAGRWTPTRLPAGNSVSGGTSTGSSSTNQGWWCSGQWGCFANESRFTNQFSLTGGLIVRF